MKEKLQKLASGRYPYLLLAGISLFAVLPVLFVGMHGGADLPQHVQFASTYSGAILDGDPFPGWGAGENLGYGSLGVRFYPPLSALLTGAIFAATGSWHASFVLAVLIFTLAGGIGVLFLAREFVSDQRALIAAAFFVLSPYHLSEIFTTSLYAEYAGTALLPFSLFFIARICREPRWKDAAGLGISYSLLILAHLPLTVIGSLGLAVFSLVMLSKKSLGAALIRLSAGAAGALAATSFFWLKIVFESDLMRHTKLWRDRIFDYDQHFLLTVPSDEVFGIWFNNLILLSLIAIVACSWYGWARSSRDRENSVLRAPLVLFFFAVFMTTPLSYPLWMFVPYLSETQFPWRWMAVASAPAAVIAGAGMPGFVSLARERFTVKSPAVWAAVVLVVLTAGSYNKIVSKFAREHVEAHNFDAWAAEQVRSKGFEYFWNLEANERTFETSERVEAGDRNVSVESWGSEDRRFRIGAGTASEARIATLYYPHWKAEADGRSIDVRSGKDGAITIELPQGETEVRLHFEEPVYVATASYVSAAVWLILFLGALLLPGTKKAARG